MPFGPKMISREMSLVGTETITHLTSLAAAAVCVAQMLDEGLSHQAHAHDTDTFRHIFRPPESVCCWDDLTGGWCPWASIAGGL